jgi:hypothetical protein
MNGIEVAVKFPKIKLKLRDKDLKKFAKEVALQAKVRVTSPSDSMFFASTTVIPSSRRLRFATRIVCKSSPPASTPPTPSSSWSGCPVATGSTDSAATPLRQRNSA